MVVPRIQRAHVLWMIFVAAMTTVLGLAASDALGLGHVFTDIGIYRISAEHLESLKVIGTGTFLAAIVVLFVVYFDVDTNGFDALEKCCTGSNYNVERVFAETYQRTIGASVPHHGANGVHQRVGFVHLSSTSPSGKGSARSLDAAINKITALSEKRFDGVGRARNALPFSVATITSIATKMLSNIGECMHDCTLIVLSGDYAHIAMSLMAVTEPYKSALAHKRFIGFDAHSMRFTEMQRHPTK